MYWTGYPQVPITYSYQQPQYYPSYPQPTYQIPLQPQYQIPTVFRSYQPSYPIQQSIQNVSSRIITNRSIPLRQSTFYPQSTQVSQLRVNQSPLRKSYGPNQFIYGSLSPARMPLVQSPAKRAPQFQPQVRSKQQPKVPYQQSIQKQQQQPPQPITQSDEDDLDKRFAEAIDRTKKIVEKYSLEDTKKKQNPNNQQQQPKQKEVQNPKKAEQPQKENLEDLALQYEDGFIYRGQGIPPQTRQGFGVLSDAQNNEVYAGFWKDNLYDGDGRLTNLQQEQIESPLDWNNMTLIGNGWATYEGKFQSGKMHGKGELLLTNGEKYSGEFIDGMVHGEGEFTTYDNNQVKGVWDSGILVQLLE